jgi:class 3 adenylate cyclase/tetratricopeptide (TPR) repeat protein
MERRLVTILAADAVAFSRRLAADEGRTLAALVGGRQLMERVAQDRGGRLISSPGDFLLCEFASTTDALDAALLFLDALSGSPGGRTNGASMRYRIGIELGEVVGADGDVLGSAVNLAARLQQLAKPNQILVSRNVHEIARHRRGLTFRSLGPTRIKNMPTTSVYAVRRARAPAAGAAPAEEPARGVVAAGAEREPPAIVVLPFQSLDARDATRTLSLSLAEQLLACLGTLRSATVYDRIPPRGRGVYVLGGTVETERGLAVTVRLTELATGRSMWSDRFGSAAGSSADVQTRIIREALEGLQISLTEGEQARLWHRSTTALAAWENFQKAKELERRHHRDSHLQARALYRRALEADPDYAAAIVALGFCHLDEARLGWSLDESASIEAARTLERRAARLTVEYPDLHALRAFIHLLDGDHAAAIAEGHLAVGLAPRSSEMAGYIGTLSRAVGDHARALGWYERALELSPVNPAWVVSNMGNVHLFAGRIDAAQARYSDALSRDPDFLGGHVGMALVLLRRGARADAARHAETISRIDPMFETARWARRFSFGRGEDVSRLVEDLRSLGLR